MRPSSCAGGSVFILTLWTLFFLGALALGVGAYVSANTSLAGQAKATARARALACGAVERAVAELLNNPTNWTGIADAELRSDPGLFKDNDGLAGGVFSVWYTFVPEHGGPAVTNYGLLCEGRKLNLNRGGAGNMAKVLREKAGLDEQEAAEVAAGVAACRRGGDKSGVLTESRGWSYHSTSRDGYTCEGGKFCVLEELLLTGVVGDRPGLYGRMEPFVTVFGRSCFSATAVGKALAGGTGRWRGGQEAPLAEWRIDFVVNRNGTIVYWHER
jgi:hypothetical protein